MKDVEILKERKMCSMCTDCSDEICFNCKRVNGATLKEIESAFDAAIQALQAQAERDKMRCENCKHRVTHQQNNDMTCDNISGLVFLKPNHFCNHFEPKENEND